VHVSVIIWHSDVTYAILTSHTSLRLEQKEKAFRSFLLFAIAFIGLSVDASCSGIESLVYTLFIHLILNHKFCFTRFSYFRYSTVSERGVTGLVNADGWETL
jgi:hypothetical protein